MSWELFISHASEDKSEVAIPIAAKLRKEGITVWLDIDEIRLGDSIRERIDYGLTNCRYGLVILSENYINKKWTNNELNAFFSLEDLTRKRILPVLHNVSLDTVALSLPVLSDRATVSTDSGLDHVVSQIIRVIRPESYPSKLSEERYQVKIDDGIYSQAKLMIDSHECDEAIELLSKHSFRCSEKRNAKIISIICYLIDKDIFSLNNKVIDSISRKILTEFNLGNPLAVCLIHIIYYEYCIPKKTKLRDISKSDILSSFENSTVDIKYAGFIRALKISRQTSILIKSSIGDG